MHKLDRPGAPACLARFQYGRDNWSDVAPDAKSEIWQQLDKMQQERCAYCERKINTGANKNAHIEHFRQRGRYPQGTFDWDNIFGSCNQENSCGKNKDRLPAYNHEDLIKMDVEDPDDFFLFISDGTISIRSDLSDHDKHRATETLRIFNIDEVNGPLRRMREIAVQGYIQTAEELFEMAMEFDKD